MESNSLWIGALVTLALSLFAYYQITRKIPSRRRHDQAPKSENGLVAVADYSHPATAHGIDVVFVHGLGSNPDTTWRAEKPPTTTHLHQDTSPENKRYTNWVTDFLPHDLSLAGRDVRLFFYNYDSYWKKDSLDTRLSILGNGLLENINGTIRSSERERSRGLIFVAYSYGGLVVKQALIKSKTDKAFGYVIENTKAILFLGTPHRGSSFSRWGWFAAWALWLIGSNPSIMYELHYDSKTLLDLHRTYMDVVENGMLTFNFFEQRPTDILRLWIFRWQKFCVNEQSATYDGSNVRSIALPVDHYGLNKFGSKSEPYRLVLSRLFDAVSSFSPSTKRCYSVPVETVGTYVDRNELFQELTQKLEVSTLPHSVAIHGLGGSGKSQLALKYAESYRSRYNPILWIDATDAEAVRSGFQRCAAELGLVVEQKEKEEGRLADSRTIQMVLRWLREREDLDDEWLFIIDNADDFKWNVKDVIPKGKRGRIIITSQNEQSWRLSPGECERIRVDQMRLEEGRELLLRHLGQSTCLTEMVKQQCDEVAQKLGYLSLAIDLAGAYISNDPSPVKGLGRYIMDYQRHQDELLQMNAFQGLRATEKTVWTVWNATLERITEENGTNPDLLLTLLAHFKGTIIQDEVFRLASLGMVRIDRKWTGALEERIPKAVAQFLPLNGKEWDDFTYRQCKEVLLRYSLLQRANGEWAGVTMHKLVQWRALQRNQSHAWNRWYLSLMIAASCQLNENEKDTGYRRYLIVHLPEIKDFLLSISEATEYECFSVHTINKIYYKEGRWGEAEELLIQALKTFSKKLGDANASTLATMNALATNLRKQGQWKEAEELQMKVLEARKIKLGDTHTSTLNSMHALAISLRKQGQLKEAKELKIKVLEARKIKLGDTHTSTLNSMHTLAISLRKQGQWKEAEELQMKVLEARKIKLGSEHPNTLATMNALATSLRKQGQWKEAEELQMKVLEARKIKLGSEHPDTLKSMHALATSLWKQGQWKEAEELQIKVLEARRIKLGSEHPDTLKSMHALAISLRTQGQLKEAKELQIKVLEARKIKLGSEHPNTLNTMHALATSLQKQGQWKEAEELQVKVLEARKIKLGSEHPDTLATMRALASTRRKQGESTNVE